MEAHLDVHPDDYPVQLPEIGQITGVFARDHAENPTGAITLYQVTLYPQAPSTGAVLPLCACKGQLSGGNEVEDPLEVDQWVIVGFLGGDPNRPYIDGLWFDQENTSVAETTAQHPRYKAKKNGVVTEIDKDGNITLSLASNKDLTIQNDAGDTILSINKVGAVYEIHLGGSTGLKKLMHEDMINIYNNHTHVAPVGGGATTPPGVSLTTLLHATSLTTGK